jgi:hypothetical protein
MSVSRAGLVGVALVLWTLAAAAQQPPELPELSATELTLSWQDFKSIVERTYVPPTPPVAPPKDAFLRAAEYTGRLDRGVLTLDATLEVEALKRGWVKIPLWADGAILSFDGDGALLHRNGRGVEAVAQGPRSFRMRARLVLPASDHPGENRISLTLPDAPLNLLDLEAGPGLRDLEVEAGLAYRRQPGRVWVALVGGKATVRYTLPFARSDSETGEELELEPRVLVTAYQLLGLGEGVVQGTLVHDYEVQVAKVDHFDVTLEDGVEVFDASAPGLESWKILQREGERLLRIKLAAPTEGAVRVVISFEGSYDPEAGVVQVPRYRPDGVERESGFVAVAADGAEVDLELDGNLLPADVSEIPPDIRGWGGNLVTGFKYSGAPDHARVKVTEHEDAPVLMAIVERLNATSVLLANGTEASWIDLVVKNNRKQFLKLRVPEGEVEIWSLLVDGQPTRPKQTGNDVLVPLPTTATEVTTRISLVLLRRGQRIGGLSSLVPYLPSFDIPVSEAFWSLYLPPDKLYSVSDEAFFVVANTAAVRRGLEVGYRLAPMGPVSETEGAVSADTYAAQKEQEAQITRQLKARQGASRKGALPVRIALPGGISSMAKVSVARILMVDETETVLRVRAYPRWTRSLTRFVQVMLILAAGLFVGLLVVGRLPRQKLPWVAALSVAALIPFGGIGVITAVFLAGLVVAAVFIASSLARRRRGQAED